MLYLDFWASYWQNLADIAAKGQHRELESSPSETTTDSSLAPQPKPAHPLPDYLAQYGTQILCMFDAAGRCTSLSSNFETITGQACDALLGHAFYNVVHDDYRERLADLLTTPEASVRHFRCKLQHSDAKWYWYVFSIHPRKDGAPGESIGIAENIHEHMQTLSTLQKAKLEAELALRARSEFLANMSHDLRTPLNAVIGFSQMIESGMFGKIQVPQYAEYIKHIQTSGYDLLAQIEDLLEIANIDAGRVSLEREEVPLAEVLRHVQGAQAHHAQAAHITLDCSSPPVDVLLSVDRLKLQHILGHLIANAIEHSRPSGGVTLSVNMRGGELQFSVSDEGAGMAPEKLAAVLAALKEDHCWTATSDDRAIGLGLALTREFAALHGGRVHISSDKGHGTTVTVALPKDCIKNATLVKSSHKKNNDCVVLSEN